MSQSSDLPLTSGPMITCSNCHSAMPAELRFCRNCGFRLGTGFSTNIQPFTGTSDIAAAGSAPLAPRKRRRISGMAWVFIGLLIFFVGAAAFTALISPVRQGNMGIVTIQQPVKSYVGVDGWDTVDNGVTFGSVDAPGGPADKAGLIGGDIITKFDGKEIHDEDQMDELMKETPIGKTVEVEYLRDGEAKTTKLTTVSIDEFRRLQREFEKRPEGRGHFGYEEGDTEIVEIPGTNIRGLRLDRVLASRPADLAGIKKGDVIIEFDGVPIRTSDEFLMRVRRAIPYETIKVVVMRNEEKLEIPVKMGKG
jgi:membrane-associated protease RseP (regulator of RpoE activity)